MKSLRLAALAALAAAPLAAQPAPGPAPAAAASSTAPFPRGPGSLSGIWMNAAYVGTGRGTPRDRAIKTAEGTPPPLLPEAAALLEKRIAGADAGRIFANSLSRCLPGGMPEMMLGAPYPIQVIEQPGQVTMLFEEQNHFRVIRMGGTHPADPDPSWMGDSIGHWEGDVLVVDTVGLNDRATIDMVGTPQSEKIHLVERYRRVGPDRIELAITVDDPGTFSKPWTIASALRRAAPDTRINEYICENNRNDVDGEGFQSFSSGGGK
jgi:hypothetical protein